MTLLAPIMIPIISLIWLAFTVEVIERLMVLTYFLGVCYLNKYKILSFVYLGILSWKLTSAPECQSSRKLIGHQLFDQKVILG